MDDFNLWFQETCCLIAEPIVASDRSRPQRFAGQHAALPWVLASVLLAVLLIASVASRFVSRTQPHASVQASFLPPPGCAFTQLSDGNAIQLTGDGASLAFIATCKGASALWVRTVATGQMRQLPGTSDAIYYFWSPDGRSLGFFAAGYLKRIDVESGAIRNLARAANGRGGSWGSNGTIVFAPDVFGPLYQVPADGGTVQQATKPGIAAGGRIVSDRNPYFLPDGQHFLYAESNGAAWGGGERLAELGKMTSRQLLDVPSNVTYADGRLLYIRDGLLMSQPFDLRHAELSGRPAAVVPEIETDGFRVDGNFTASASGMLVFRGLGLVDATVELFDAKTNATTVLLAHTSIGIARISPDGRYVLANRQTESGQTRSLSLFRVDGGIWTQLVDGVPSDYNGLWSRDGRTVASVGPADERTITITPVDGSQATQLKFARGSAHFLASWSPDGRSILADVQSSGGGWDIERLDISGGMVTPTPIIATAADEVGESSTRDGRLIAYSRTQNGPTQLHIARLPSGKPDVQVSQSFIVSGTLDDAAWSPDGHTLYFIDASGTLMSASIDDRPELRASIPKAVAGAPGNLTSVDVADDGRLLLVSDNPVGPVPLTLVQNWMQLVKQ